MAGDKLFNLVGGAVLSFFGDASVDYDLTSEGSLEIVHGHYCNPNVIVVVQVAELEPLDGLKEHIEEELNKNSLSEVNVFVRRGYSNN